MEDLEQEVPKKKWSRFLNPFKYIAIKKKERKKKKRRRKKQIK